MKFIKIVTLSTLFFISSSMLYSQSVPVTLHYKPTISNFNVLRLVGNFNGWNNNSPTMVMTDPDGDGVYEITIELAKNVEHLYKFVMDANWGLAWNDPDNPLIKLTDNNNSILYVGDPMITYLLPRNVNSSGITYVDTTKNGEPIRAIFAYTAGNAIDPNTLVVVIDGDTLDNASQYYIEGKKEFYYQPTVPLANGEHTVNITASSQLGSVTKTTTFERNPDLVVYKVPVDFYYDKNNTSASILQNINSVSLVGDFNNWNEEFNTMQDNDGDGLWETTAEINEGTYEYKFKLNNSLWAIDPDEPSFSEVNVDNNLITAVADSIPFIKLISPPEGTVYNNDGANFVFKSLLRPGVKSLGVNQSSIQVTVDGSPAVPNYDSGTREVTANVTLNGEGNHVVGIQFSNNDGLTVSETYSYGVFTGVTGYYSVDAVDDEPYSYPAGVESGSADILSILIDETVAHDSIKFSINMKKISDRTRIGLLISNPVSTTAEAPLSLDIRTEDWQGEGVFIPIGIPGNIFENNEIENRFWEGRDPETYSSHTINVNSDAAATGTFNFNISLAYLDSLIGGWTRERHFHIFSYLANENKSGNSFEVTSAEGGSDNDEDPDIYDAAFFRSGFWQSRILANYIPAGSTNGPRNVSINAFGRGRASIFASDVSDSLATYGPVVTFLTPVADYWNPELTVVGTLNDLSISSVTFYYNDVESTVPVVDGKFSVPIVLIEGENKVYVKAVDNNNFESISRTLVLTYEKDKTPFVKIIGSVTGRSVTLTAESSSPADLPMTYFWSKDATNPAFINVISAKQTITFTVPQVDGEYYTSVRAKDSEGRTVNARRIIIADGDSVYLNEISEHSRWIDSAIVYEIYPRSYSSEGDFNGIKNKIPDMINLGINTVWLMPVYKGPTTHGYEITDYYDFEEDYGTAEEFQQLVDALHGAGIRVILDFVVNHTSIQHPFMQNVLEYGEYSPWKDFYIWAGEPGHSNYEYYFDWASLPNLNHKNSDVRKYFIDVAKYWVNTFNIDGYRCDVAWGVESRNTDFWQEWREALKNIKPEVFLEAEASSAESVFYNNRFDSANDWELRNRILEAVNGTNTIEALDAELRRNYKAQDRPFRFLENHDENRVASTHGTERSKLMHTIIMTANGVPLIYSGGEVGEQTNRDLIDWSDQDNIRPYFRLLIDLRKKYLVNPEIERLTNNDPLNIYSYSSISGNNVVVTVANLREGSKTATVDLSGLPNDGISKYYLTDLIDGSVQEVSVANLGSIEVSLNGYEAKVFYFGTESVTVGVNEDDEVLIKSEFELNQNYPNPFNPTTKIRYQIPEAGKVSLKVYDLLGREIRTLVNEEKNPGRYEVEFNASSLASGVYFYRIVSGNYTSVKKLMLIK